MNIFKTGFTLMFAQHGPGRDLRLRVSPIMVKIITVLAVIFVALIVYFLSIYGRIYYLAYQCKHYQETNQQLRSSMNNLEKIKRELRISDGYRKKFSNLLGIEKTPPPINLEVAIGSEQKKRSNLNVVIRRDVPSIPPVQGFISRGFSKDHPAIDIAAPMGTPIVAPADGVISDAGWDSIYGNYLTIKHGNYSTFYGHLFQAEVGLGDKVVTGKVIGYVGSTGVSTSSHLHYEVKLKGRQVDPRTYFIR